MTTVRPLTREDREVWQPLWEAYLRFYRALATPEWSDATFAALVGSDERVAGLLAVGSAGRVIGLAHVVFHASTWSPRDSCYLNDLFVARDERGAGAGAALIEAVYAAATARDCDKVYWHTQEFNAPARSLYDTVGTLTSYRVYEHELPTG
jgi:GNAT superfamily N-acetyltransferase